MIPLSRSCLEGVGFPESSDFSFVGMDVSASTSVTMTRMARFATTRKQTIKKTLTAQERLLDIYQSRSKNGICAGPTISSGHVVVSNINPPLARPTRGCERCYSRSLRPFYVHISTYVLSCVSPESFRLPLICIYTPSRCARVHVLKARQQNQQWEQRAMRRTPPECPITPPQWALSQHTTWVSRRIVSNDSRRPCTLQRLPQRLRGSLRFFFMCSRFV